MSGPERPAGERPVRAFVALALGGTAREPVEALLARLRASADAVAWARPESLHLTLKFLGGVAPAVLPALATRLAAVAAGCQPFELEISGCGAFPSLARPRVLWVGAAAPGLAALAAAVDRACADAGFPPERRAFHAHLTLGRVRARRGAAGGGTDRVRQVVVPLVRARAAERFGRSPADALLLMRSDLGPRGARYTELARSVLGAASPGR